MRCTDIIKDLNKVKKQEKGIILSSFFKTGPGEYGEGDIFLGVTMPDQHKLAAKYKELPIEEVKKLVQSPIHEHRMTGLLILVNQYKRAQNDPKVQEKIYQFYIKNRKFINNWDLVDVTTPKIVGDYLLKHPEQRKLLYQLARSEILWDRRIAVLATYTFIRADDYKDILKISKILLNDPHDLIHKAVGWMLRELGKKDLAAEESFLKLNHRQMPRTMLRYAIEKFPEKKRKLYLSSAI